MSGLIRFSMVFNFPNAFTNECVMTGHINMTGAGTPADADVDAVNTMLKTWWESGNEGEAALKTNCSAGCTLTKVVSQAVQPGPPATPRELASGVVGSVSGTALPPQCAVVMSLRTNLSGRSYRGRMYLPGIADADLGTGGAITSARQQAIADSADGMRRSADALFGTNGELCVYSRKLDHKERVVLIKVGNRVDIQRRRKMKPESYVIGS